MRVPLSLVVVGAALVAGAAACGGSGYQYVENDELGVYAKLPDDWTVYDESDLFPEESERELARRQAQMWTRTFDAGKDPSVEGSQSAGDDDPTGPIREPLEHLFTPRRSPHSPSRPTRKGQPFAL